MAWVGDNELLIRDAGGVERDLAVEGRTRLLVEGKPVDLGAMQQGDEVRATYDEGPGGLVAREVEVLSEPSAPGSAPQGGAEQQRARPEQEGSREGARDAPPR